MKSIPEIVREHVLETQGRMPETESEVNEYLDLINLAKEYAQAKDMETLIGLPLMRKLGFKTPDEIRRIGKKLFKASNQRS